MLFTIICIKYAHFFVNWAPLFAMNPLTLIAKPKFVKRWTDFAFSYGPFRRTLCGSFALEVSVIKFIFYIQLCQSVSVSVWLYIQ